MHIFSNAAQFASWTLIVQQLRYAQISPLPILLLGGEEEGQVVEWAYSRSSSRSGRSRFNGLARPARVSENLALHLLPRLAGYFSGPSWHRAL